MPFIRRERSGWRKVVEKVVGESGALEGTVMKCREEEQTQPQPLFAARVTIEGKIDVIVVRGMRKGIRASAKAL